MRLKLFFRKTSDSLRTKRRAQYILCVSALTLLAFAAVLLMSAHAAPPHDGIFSELSYAAFGDSITYGYSSETGGQMPNPYPELVAKRLGLKSYENYGVGGATLLKSDVRWNMTEKICSTTEHYDIISVMGGVNDYGMALPLGTPDDSENDTVYGSLDMVAKHLKSTYPDAFIFFMTPFPTTIFGESGTAPNSAGYTVEDVADAVKTVAARYDIPVLDIYNDGKYELEMHKPGGDGLHPSQQFMVRYTAPQIEEFILKNYK